MTGKKTLRIQFKEESIEYKMIEQFDKDILTLCSKNWPRWFNGQQKTVEQLVETYSRSLKLKDQNGNAVPPGFGTKLDLDEIDVSVFDGEDEADLDEMLSGFKILSRTRHEHTYEKQGSPLFSSRWQVLAEKTS